MAKKVVTLKKKRTKSKPLCYVDSKGNVRHRKGGRSKGKGSILVKKAVDSKLLKLRKAGKICLYLKGKVGKTLSIWQGKGLKLARKKRGKKKRRKGSRGRKKKSSLKSKRAGKKAWKTRVRKYGKSGCKKGRRKTKPRRCRRRRVRRPRRRRR